MKRNLGAFFKGLKCFNESFYGKGLTLGFNNPLDLGKTLECNIKQAGHLGENGP
jgi:hypothetical protein